MRASLKVIHFQRCPPATFFSIERVFDAIRRALPPSVDCQVKLCRFPSLGLWRRCYNALEAAFRQGEVNHITGDVHYLTYLCSKRRTVLTVLDCGPMMRLKGVRRWAFRLLWLEIPVRKATVITTISEFSRAELEKYVVCGKSKVRVIGVPVDAEFRPEPRVFNTERPVILQVGTAANKNIERVALALRGVSCQLHIVGELSPAQTQALLENQICWAAFVSLSSAELLDQFRACDMVVFASTYEGFGMPIVEANAIGRPVVTSTVCSMPEVAGEAACLVDPFDAESIRAGVLRVIQERSYREALIEKGLKNATRFRPEVIAQQYANIYEEVAGRTVAHEE